MFRLITKEQFAPDDVERFWNLVSKGTGTSDCWMPRSQNFYWHGEYLIASRVAYVLEVGELNPILLVCHHCDNFPCCNPSHLFEGSHADNVQDSYNKGLRRPRSLGGNVKVSFKDIPALVEEYHELVAQGKGRGPDSETCKLLATRYQASPSRLYQLALTQGKGY